MTPGSTLGSFAVPGVFALGASIPGFHALSAAWLLLLAPPLILFYFLKLKRPRLIVPCLVLWQQVLRDQRVNSPFQKFKRNILLFLQLALLLLLILAAMQPYWRGDADDMRRLPVLIDCSASMAALDKPGGTSRLELAKQRVREMIQGLGRGQQMCLIAFARTGTRLTDFTDNKRVLLDALDSIQVQDVPSDIEDALRIAQAIALREPFERVLLLSDGNFPAQTTVELSFDLDYQKLPAAGVNMGITAMSATRMGVGRWDVFVKIDSTAREPSPATLELLRDGQIAAVQDIAVTAGRAERLVFPIFTDRPESLEIRLKPDDFDALASDNVAYLNLEPPRPITVYAAPTLATYRLALAAMSEVQLLPVKDEPVQRADFDLIISDQLLGEETNLVADTALFVGVVPAELSAMISVNEQSTSVVDWLRDAPLLRHVELADLLLLDNPAAAANVHEREIEALGYEVLAHGRQGPLLLQKRTGPKLHFYLLAHTDRSTLPYRVGFPILAANLVKIAMQQAGLAETPGSRTGVLPPVEALPGQAVRVRMPDGTQRHVAADQRGMVSGVAAPRVGQYQFLGGASLDQRLGASLLSESESLLAAADAIQFSELTVAAAAAEMKIDRSFWPTLAGLALLMLMIEWWYFQRKPGGFREARG